MRVILVAVLATFTFGMPVYGQQPAQPPASDNAAYYFLLGRHLEASGQIDDAIAAHKHAIALQPDSAELRAELAALYARRDRALEAVEMAESALQRDSSNREANRILGSVYAELIDQKQPLRPGDNPSRYAALAIGALEKARRDNVFDVGLELTLGRLYLQTGAFAKAIPLLQRVADDQPDYPEAAMLLAAAQEQAGDAGEAARTLERALRANADFYRGQVLLAEIYDRQHRWADAADAYARAQALNPRVSALTARRAAALINSGRPSEARDLVSKALGASTSETQDPMLLYLLAEAQWALHDLTAAEATAQKLLAVDPKDARGLHVLSLILQNKGDTKAAERTLRDLIARNPLDANALNSLGYMLAERGERLQEAVELLQRALKIEPANPAFLDSLGWAYFQQGRLDLADTPLTEAAEKLQNSSVVQEHLGDLRFKQQRYADAAAAWERALAGDGQSIDREKIQKKIRDAQGRLEQR